jgi:hypothetical protein
LYVRDAVPILQENIAIMQNLQLDAQKLQQHQAVILWLSTTDYPAQQYDIISRKQEGTGTWLLHAPEFKEWIEGNEKTLFCPGIPGAGKTMMAAIAIDHISRQAQSDVGLAYLFCNYKSQADQNLNGLLCALLKQLVQSRPDIIAPVTRLYDQHLHQKSKPSLSDLSMALKDICSSHDRVYIVVDALDECTNQDGTRNRLLDTLHDIQTKSKLSLLFTSRFVPDISEKFQSSPVLEVRASEEDVKRFIAGQIPRLPSCIRRDDDLSQQVQDKISKAIDGMYVILTVLSNNTLLTISLGSSLHVFTSTRF